MLQDTYMRMQALNSQNNKVEHSGALLLKSNYLN